MKLGFIGAGRMAQAMIRGLLAKKSIQRSNIFISDKDSATLKQVSKKYGVKTSSENQEVAMSCDVIILAVKPQVMHAVLSEIKGRVKQSQLVISIAAGINIKSLEKYLPRIPVIRAMPNNPCLVGEGVTLVCGGAFTRESEIKTAEKLFAGIGDVIRIEERQMNAVTALSGSGPAFVYEVVEALTDGGMEAGLPKALAVELANKTVLGSVKTIIKTRKSPEELKGMVISPGGTTVAGLRIMDEADFKGTLKKAVVKASARAKEISEEFERSL